MLRRVLVPLLCLIVVLGLATGPALAKPRSGALDAKKYSHSVAGDSCDEVTARMAGLDTKRARAGGENSLRAGARRRLGAVGVTIFGGPVRLQVSQRVDATCDEAARALRYAFAHAGHSWIPGEGGPLLGQGANWTCGFLGVKMDPSQEVGGDVWSDPDSDVLCNARGASGGYFLAKILVSPGEHGGPLALLMGPPGAHFVECRIPPDGPAALCEVKQAGPGRGLARLLARVGGYGVKALRAARARVGRIGVEGLRARELLGLERFARERARELQGLLPEVRQRKVTMAVGIGKEIKKGGVGKGSTVIRRVVVGSSEKPGYVRSPVRQDIKRQGEAIASVPGKQHAEMRILEYMDQHGIEPITVGAGRPICGACAEAIRRAGATVANEVRAH